MEEDLEVDLDLLEELLWRPDFDCSDLLQTNTSTSNFDDRVAAAAAAAAAAAGRPLCAVVRPSSSTGVDQLEAEGPVATVRQRLSHALRYIKESHRDSDILVQIWIPIMRGDKKILTTHGQPFSLDSDCRRLVDYRTASTRYQFMADEGSHRAVGLPGRVFLEKLPEWSPDVRFFNSYEYPRLRDAQRFDVRGTIALPIFEKEKRSCLGVVELVMITQKVNYSSDIETICNALKTVDLRTSEAFGVPRLPVSYINFSQQMEFIVTLTGASLLCQMAGDSYRTALPEIRTVLKTACESHRLPLAQTWISCHQQGKTGNRHSDETFLDCISTVDDACYVQDPTMADFQRACSEHHLLRGQGVAGKAFTTNQPCFASNITDFSKIDYPLSHHAKLFDLRAAAAIRLRCVSTGKIDFVLEFFLPASYCIESEEQKLMLTIRQACKTLRLVTNREVEDESTLFRNNERNLPGTMESREGSSNNLFPASVQGKQMKKEHERFSLLSFSSESSALNLNMKKSKRTKTEKTVNLQEDERTVLLRNNERNLPAAMESREGSSNNLFPASVQGKQMKKEHESFSLLSFSTESSALNLNLKKSKRTKTEKTVNLQELQKHFAGSLKDAAKSLAVCPTTLKRICRQHGINRWPSRKIKKVGHSLKKLQVVIDSVHGSGGGGGGIQFSSLYEKFIKTTFSFSKPHDHPPESSNLNRATIEGRFALRNSGSNSLSSSCSQNSNSSQGCSSEQKQCDKAHELVAPVEDTLANKIEAQTHIELHLPIQELQMDHCNSLANLSLLPLHQHDLFKVKAVCGEEKVTFRLHPAWGFQDLKQEILYQFGIADSTSVDIKYLDDDSEWILLTCDDDLKECTDVYKQANAHTIKLSILHVAQPTTRSSW